MSSISETKLELFQLADEAFAELASRFPEAELQRVRGFIDNATGRTVPVFHALQSTTVGSLHFPGLPCEPFYDTGLFPEAAELERNFDAIRDEVRALVDRTVEPVRYEKRFPAWKKLMFYDGGANARIDATCAAFPATSGIVDRIVREYDDFLTVGFLIHDGQFVMPPHADWFNLFISLWLPVAVPAGCGLEVGGERRLLEAGKCIAFDNSFRHTSWNHTDEQRIALAIYRMTPRLTRIESQAFLYLRDTYGDRLFNANAAVNASRHGRA